MNTIVQVPRIAQRTFHVHHDDLVSGGDARICQTLDLIVQGRGFLTFGAGWIAAIDNACQHDPDLCTVGIFPGIDVVQDLSDFIRCPVGTLAFTDIIGANVQHNDFSRMGVEPAVYFVANLLGFPATVAFVIRVSQSTALFCFTSNKINIVSTIM
jgi:hypothetical protein